MLVRVVLPLAITAAGIVLIAVGGGHTKRTVTVIGVLLIVVAMMVWMINWLFQMSVQSNRDRDREEQARKYYDQHGRWPGE